MQLIMTKDEIPPDLLKYFEPVQEQNKIDVWTISTKPYSGAHFATFPPDLVEPMILAGTSARGCCPVCGAPWERVVELGEVQTTGGGPGREASGMCSIGNRGNSNTGKMAQHEHVTTGWRPTCEHDADPVPCQVLDPFAGSGTVGEVCIIHQREFIGIELNPDYIELAEDRTDGVQVRLL